MGDESVSNAAADPQTYFGCAMPAHIEIRSPLTSVSKGRGKRTKTGVERAIEHQSCMQMYHCYNQVASHDGRNCLESRCYYTISRGMCGCVCFLLFKKKSGFAMY